MKMRRAANLLEILVTENKLDSKITFPSFVVNT